MSSHFVYSHLSQQSVALAPLDCFAASMANSLKTELIGLPIFRRFAVFNTRFLL